MFYFFSYFCTPKTHFSARWSVRLSVRTSGFHPGKRGSIPLRTTIKKLKTACRAVFKFLSSCSVIGAQRRSLLLGLQFTIFSLPKVQHFAYLDYHMLEKARKEIFELFSYFTSSFYNTWLSRDVPLALRKVQSQGLRMTERKRKHSLSFFCFLCRLIGGGFHLHPGFG